MDKGERGGAQINELETNHSGSITKHTQKRLESRLTDTPCAHFSMFEPHLIRVIPAGALGVAR